MNITLSADKELIEKAREYAAKHSTSLNQIIRQYMEKLTSVADVTKNAEEFKRLALEEGGASRSDFVFYREEAHARR